MLSELTGLSLVCPQQLLPTVMTSIVVDKSTDNTEPNSICFLPQYSTPKKMSTSDRDQARDTKKSKRCLQLSRNLSGLFPEVTRAALSRLLSTTTN